MSPTRFLILIAAIVAAAALTVWLAVALAGPTGLTAGLALPALIAALALRLRTRRT